MKTQKMNVRDHWNQWSAWIRKICFGKMNKAVKQKITLSSGRNENPDEVLLKFRIWNSSRLSILSKCSQSLVILNNLDG